MGKKKELNNANFGWSLKPITVLMAIFGQEIWIVNHNRRKIVGKPSRSNLISMIGLTIIVSNTFINIMSFKKVNTKYGSKDTITYVSHLTTHLFHDLVVIGIPLSFIIIRFFNRGWKEVISTLEMIQSEMNLSQQVHKEIRNCALFSVFFFLFVSTLKTC